jgi:hypothetical protein
VESPPVRWALICIGTPVERFALRRIPEERIDAWEGAGWTVYARDSDIWFEGLDDVYRQDKERGNR